MLSCTFCYVTLQSSADKLLVLEYGAGINARNDAGSIPLHWAAYMRHPEVVRVLLERGADPNIPWCN
jgi:ankyrin repeat protein